MERASFGAPFFMAMPWVQRGAIRMVAPARLVLPLSHQSETDMSCACGHHHNLAPTLIQGGQEIALDRPLVAVDGRLICQDALQMMLALDLLPEHVAASRAEPGNLRFDLRQSDDPLIWDVQSLFIDQAAFASHQTRSAAGPWGQQGQQLANDLHQRDLLPRLRPEAGSDHSPIRSLLTLAFDRPDEARLVDNLREQDDLALSLVADAGGAILGHLALSPIKAARPALALAPVAVHPALHGRGIGSALIRAAIEQFSDHLIVVLGEPAYYSRFGFQPVTWQSPYAGPYLQALGPDLPAELTIAHASAFGDL